MANHVIAKLEIIEGESKDLKGKRAVLELNEDNLFHGKTVVIGLVPTQKSEIPRDILETQVDTVLDELEEIAKVEKKAKEEFEENQKVSGEYGEFSYVDGLKRIMGMLNQQLKDESNEEITKNVKEMVKQSLKQIANEPPKPLLIKSIENQKFLFTDGLRDFTFDLKAHLEATSK